MRYFITFLEGVITFISPCVLPMIPVYVMYFAADGGEKKKGRALVNSLGFVGGFTVLFLLLGALASSLGSLLSEHQTAVNLVTGAVVVFFGLHYTGLFKIPFLNKTVRPNTKLKPSGFLSAMLFGIVFAVGWSPCTGAFLGSAIMLASQQAQLWSGLALLMCYAAGLGVPFILCALLIDSLKGALSFIKSHYKTVNLICGIFLIIIGILMMTGVFSRLSSLVS